MKRVLTFLLMLTMVAVLPLSFASCNGLKVLYGKEVLSLGSQLDALNGLKRGDSDIAVIDSVMAGYYMNDTDAFSDYQILPGVVLAEEEYGIAAKKGNEALMGKINEALIALSDTDYKTVAATYGLSNELLVTKDTVNPYANATDSSWTDLVTSKRLVIGYTVFAPIAFPDKDGADAQLIGFDIDLAKKVVDYLNDKYDTEIVVEFTKIDWSTKEAKLENGDLDLVWNGMTINEERLNAMTISVPYLANKQVAVIAKADAEKYAATSLAEFGEKAKDAVITVEKGSAGESLVLEITEE